MTIARDKAPPERVLSERTVGVINRMLVQVPEWGTGRKASLADIGIRNAGKTGTTSAYRDAWFIGYTGNYVAAVWFGNDDYTPTNRMTGGTVPAATWQKFMTFAHQNIERLPVPFVDNPFPATKAAPVAKNKSKESDDAIQAAARPKTLSKPTEEFLRELEQIMRRARPVSGAEIVAARPSGENLN